MENFSYVLVTEDRDFIVVLVFFGEGCRCAVGRGWEGKPFNTHSLVLSMIYRYPWNKKMNGKNLEQKSN